MKGIARADQYLSYYKVLKKIIKCLKKVVLYLLKCVLQCIFLLTTLNTNKKK